MNLFRRKPASEQKAPPVATVVPPVEPEPEQAPEMLDEDPYADMDRLRALTASKARAQSQPTSFSLGPVGGRPVPRREPSFEPSAPIARPLRSQPVDPDGDEPSPFAARARLAGQPESGPVRRRIWDIESDMPPGRDAIATTPASHAPEIPPESRYPETDGPARPRAEASVSEEVRLARAQIARFSEAGFAPGPVGAPAEAVRAKTRLLGFESAAFSARDPLAGPVAEAPGSVPHFPVGWIVVVEGPGRGASFTLLNGVSSIGRGEDQAVRLDFGDGSISRHNHASIAYDAEVKRFYLGHGGKSNIVRLNGRPVLSTEDLADGDTIRIGETALRFIAFCGDGFSWDGPGKDGEEADDARP